MEKLPQLPAGGVPQQWPANVAAFPTTHALPPRPDSDGAPQAMGTDVRFVGRVLMGRKWLIGATVVSLTALTAWGTLQLPDQYTSTAQLLVDNRQIHIVRDTEQITGAMPVEDQAILTEVELLKSNRVLDSVIADLDLMHNPEFVKPPKPAGEADGPSLIDTAAEATLTQARALAVALWGDLPPAYVAAALNGAEAWVQQRALAAAVHAGPAQDQVLEALRRKLEVTVIGRSRVVRVQYTARDPQLARDIVQAAVSRYMERRKDMERDMAADAIALMTRNIDTLRTEVLAAEQQAEQYRARSGLLRGTTGTMAQNELERARLQLTEASANRARLVAQADAMERVLRTGNYASIGGNLASPVVAQLRAASAQIQGELAQLTRQYGSKHPRIVELQARLNETNASLGSEIRREINGMREAADVAVAQERALQSMIGKAEASYASNLSDEGVKLRSLEAEATAKRQLMESLLSRLQVVQAQQGENAQPGGVKLASAAEVPQRPSGPLRALLIAAGFVAALLLSVALVFTLELLQRRVRTPEAVRRILGVAAVHVLPHHPVRGRKGRLYQVFQRNPFALFSESMRALFRNHLADLGPVASIAVTSARPGDGKTSLTLTVAQVAAQAGRRVVVVDTDFRRSKIDEQFGMRDRRGLADWVAGEASLDEIVHTPDDAAFAIVPAGRLLSSTLDRFNVDCLIELTAALSPHYDLVVFDTAPALAVSDARLVCAAASKVLFVTRWGHTTAADLEGIADLGPIDHEKFVCVLTDVNLKKAAQRGYQGPYQNYLATKKYYGEPTRLRA